jgi:hypothetical protein
VLASLAARAAPLLMATAAFVLAVGLYFRDLLPLPSPTRYFSSDFASYFYPVFHYVAEEIGSGRLPHWAPYVGVGYPLLSDIEASVFYPPIRLLTLLTGPPSYSVLTLYSIAHYLAAGLGMLALGRAIGLTVPAAALGGFVFMFSGFLWGHSGHLTIVQATAWLPWLLLAHARAQETRSARGTVGAGGLFALVALGGHPQVAVYASLALVLQALVGAGAPAAPTGRRRLAALAIAGAVLLLGAGLAAPQLAPTLALAPATPRWHPTGDFLRQDALTPDELLSFLIPLAYFGTDRFRAVDEVFGYVGIGPLLLAMAGAALRRDRWSRYFSLLLLVGFALALAPLLPGFGAVGPHLPLIGMFRASGRALLLTHLGAAGLAALGLDAWSRALATGEARGRVRALAWAWRAGAGVALGGGLVLWLHGVPAAMRPVSDWFGEFYAYFATLVVAHVALLELWRAGRLPGPWGPMMTVALVLVNLVFPHRALTWTVSPPDVAWHSAGVVRRLDGQPGRHRVWNEGYLHRRGSDFEANAGLLHRVEVLSHYTSLPLTRFNDFSAAVGNPWRDATVVDLLNVRYMVVSEADTRPQRGGRYAPPRLETGDERRYDLRGLLDGGIGEVTLVAEAEPGQDPPRPVSVVARGSTLDVCLGCPPDGAEPAVTVEGRTLVASATLPARHAVQEVQLRNVLPLAVAVRELRLDEVNLYELGGRYRQLEANLWENGNMLPRAFLVEEVLVVPDTRRVIPTLLSHDPRRTAIVESPPACLGRLTPSAALPPAVEMLDYESTRVRLRTRHDRPGFLVMSDAHYKEWRASVDGQRVGIHRVNLLFRGVCVPAGEHVVEFRYRPFALQRGAVLAALAALGGLGALIFPRWRRARRFP